ncbi:MAG: 7-cyano-7-deazaguanine synthase [Nitrososphaerota archaeon]|nr:7-cyano-7-deazaguanine synthase [Nitrososphaerota archaeon]
MRKAVCIISGGLDSSGVASFWKSKNRDLYLLTFDYGQRAGQEIKQAVKIGKLLHSKEHKVLDISFMKDLYGNTNVLTDTTLEMPSRFQSNIIVPIRNAVFLTIATAYAFSVGAELVAYGAHLSDKPYPDCRPAFANRLQDALNLGDIDSIKAKTHPEVKIWSPAIEGLTKAELLKISYKLLKRGIFTTWSCYLDGKLQCGKCESCRNRRAAFELAKIKDLTRYSSSLIRKQL